MLFGHGTRLDRSGIPSSCLLLIPSCSATKLPAQRGERPEKGWWRESGEEPRPPVRKREITEARAKRCELKLLRSHPKDERGSVREIGLCVIRIGPTLHFLELSLTLWWELTRCSEWSPC